MTTGAKITNNGKINILKNIYTTNASRIVTKAKVGNGTSTPLATDTDLSGATKSSLIDFTSGYPIFDTTNNKVTTRVYVNTATIVDGTIVTEIGEYFNNSSNTMMSHDVFNAKTISNTNELAIIIRHKIE